MQSSIMFLYWDWHLILFLTIPPSVDGRSPIQLYHCNHLVYSDHHYDNPITVWNPGPQCQTTVVSSWLQLVWHTLVGGHTSDQNWVYHNNKNDISHCKSKWEQKKTNIWGENNRRSKCRKTVTPAIKCTTSQNGSLLWLT